MARVPLSKSQLSKEKESLSSFRRYLPAIDLKRQQLMAERMRARQTLKEIEAKVATAIAEAGETMPMLADKRVDLNGLVKLGKVTLASQNVAGVRLPRIEDIEIIRASYGLMVRPHWVENYVARMSEAIGLRIEAQIAKRRLALLEAAVVKVTQRVNLFDKVLIPQAQQNIRRINVYLGDAERAAVVNAKIAKRKRETQGSA
jgi:V/A-type H+-transporting ATPase subunit D